MSRKIWIFGAALASAMAVPFTPIFAAGETVAVNFVSLTIPSMSSCARKRRTRRRSSTFNFIIQDAQFSTPKQGPDLENALTQGVDGIVVAPTDVKSTAPAIDEVLKKAYPSSRSTAV